MFDRMSAVVLAGGQSRRMGMDKGFLNVDGRPLVQHIASQLCSVFPEVIIAADSAERFSFLGLPIVCDAEPGQGPMGGMSAALAICGNPWVACIPCDTPDVPLEALAVLAEHATDDVQAVVPKNGEYLEPLFALYRRDTVPVMERLLHEGRRSLLRLIDKVESAIIPMDLALTNLNTPEDYRRYLERREQGRGANEQRRSDS